MKKELIVSVQSIIPTKGTNAGKTMFLVNGVHWCKAEPGPRDTHIITQEVTVGDKSYVNVVGFSADVRMQIHDKIALVTQHDAAYSTAIATLLR